METVTIERSMNGTNDIVRLLAIDRARKSPTASASASAAPRAGSLALWRARERTIVISTVEVDVKYRRRGIGTALMLEAEAYGREVYGPGFAMTLSVNKWNTKARAMYEKLGYENVPVTTIGECVKDPLRLVQRRMSRRVNG